MMSNARIADVLEEVADCLEFKGANPFRLRAYRKAARILRAHGEPLATLVEAGEKLTSIEGIGKDLADKITTLVTTSRLPMHEELKAEIPESVFALLRIPGLGPKKVAVLFNELGITTLEMLEAAAQEQQLRAIKGFGAKTEELILAGMEYAKSAAAQMRLTWAQADEVAQALRAHMEQAPGITRMELAGSYRRLKETVGDLDLLVCCEDGERVMDHFGAFPETQDVLVRGGTKMSSRLASGLQIDLRVVPEASFGAALQYFTGSKEHNVVVRSRAKEQGLRVNEWGVYRSDDGGDGGVGESVAGATETEVYAVLGLPPFPPELREGRREFDWAEQGGLPDLVTLADIRGDLHMHTTATDGKASIEEMARAAQSRGLDYIAITDHSQRVSMANGLDGERLLQQWEEVDRINDALGDAFTVLKGIECDILERGGMDLPDEVLAEADWVMASIHYGQNQSRDQITGRICDALAHPSVSALSHPTGRLLNKRNAYELDMEAVMRAAYENGKFLELNAHPKRLDLHDLHCAMAKERGIPIVINTDAHSTHGLDVLRFGIQQARRGGLTKDDVANARPWQALSALLSKAIA